MPEEIPQSSKPPARSIRCRRWRRKLRIATALLLIPPLLACLAFQAAIYFLPYPDFTDRPLSTCTWINDRSGSCIAAFTGSSGQWSMPLAEDQISPHLLNAIVAIEDSRFYNHHGVDWLSVLGAAGEDIKSLSLHRGASTISMQLFRLCQPSHRSLESKLFQAIGAAQMEQRLSKRQILVDYLNRAPFGGNLVGAGAASWRYFGRPCRDLSLGQAALLAGLPQNPTGFRPDRFPIRAKARRNRVLDRMLACGMIDQTQHDQAVTEEIDATWRPLPQDNADCLLPTLTDLAVAYPGRTLHTTIDPTIQHQAAVAAAQALTNLAPSHITAAAIVVLDTPTAQCLAAVSLTSEPTAPGKSIDLTRRPRSSGSTLKPFIYAAAFDAGICSPGSILQDSPAAWADYQPHDYDRDFLGPLTAADALAQSRNLPALLLLSKVGVPRAVDVMGAMGLTTLSHTPDQYGLPLAIGGADVTPMELAEAYATLVRGGRHRPVSLLPSSANEPADLSPSIHSIDRLIHGNVLRPQQCLQTLYCLADESRTARICPAAAPLSPAWKTGTSSGHRDAWCAAVTPRRTVIVWLGNADGSGSDELVGQEVAAPLALRILALSDTGGVGFSPPPNFDAPPDTAPVLQPRSAALTMISPSDGQEIIRDPSLPTDQQRLALRARQANVNGAQFWWFVDGTCIGRGDATQPLWWSLRSGPHEAIAVTEDGDAAHAQFVVR